MRRVEDPSPGQAVVEATVLYGSKMIYRHLLHRLKDEQKHEWQTNFRKSFGSSMRSQCSSGRGRGCSGSALAACKWCGFCCISFSPVFGQNVGQSQDSRCGKPSGQGQLEELVFFWPRAEQAQGNSVQ